jgi:alpha-L-arabinofuranosidase
MFDISDANKTDVINHSNAFSMKNYFLKSFVLLTLAWVASTYLLAQPNCKKISPDLFGIFYEDLSYAADGGLYAELVQNRSFEYTPADRQSWHSFTSWNFLKKGYAYGTISVETANPINANNPHYVLLDVENIGQEGLGLSNTGFDGISIKKGETYHLSFFAKSLSNHPLTVDATIRGEKDSTLGGYSFIIDSKEWTKYQSVITATKGYNNCQLELIVKTVGQIAIDQISLMPQNTFNNRSNGLRADISTAIAALQPKFMRFPGGCLVHGDGLGNVYNWKNTVGPVETRQAQRNIWNYHQTAGLGYFEYFQFCEDIGAKPMPIVAAGVSCQNSGCTWRIGSTGQQCLPLNKMPQYVQDVLDLIEYANGPATSTWGSKRAAAGHPKPFNLEYLGVGNEDKITPGFKERFQLIFDVLKEKHPEIKVVGTVGPAPDDEDYRKGWAFANEMQVPVVDEHMYRSPQWFWDNLNRYDNYNRDSSKVYIGEFAAHDAQRKNTLRSALAEAAFMTSLERNGDVVIMASYAPLLANIKHLSWGPDLIYFTNETVLATPNYYIQKLFSCNQGNCYYPNLVKVLSPANDSLKLASSFVKDEKTGDLIVKIVNGDSISTSTTIDFSAFKKINKSAIRFVITGRPMDENTFENPMQVSPQEQSMKIEKITNYMAPAYSLTVIRIKSK